MKNEQTYNGWSNYATWRINLELWDNFDITEEFKGLDVYELSQALKESTESYIYDCKSQGIAYDYAMAFVDQVNFYEIADHLFECNEIKTETI